METIKPENAHYNSSTASETKAKSCNSLFLEPIEVNILLVTDDIGSYNKVNDFGLSILYSVLNGSECSGARLKLKKAHRGDDKDADISNFRFDNKDHFDPEKIDEVWLFGIKGSENPDLSDKEIKIVSKFMDSGKGVFATGDHQNLGGPLCNRIPRVRSMRKWHFSCPDNPQAPPRNNSYRHDSLRKGDNDTYGSEDESDDTPQIIFPKFYQASAIPGVCEDVTTCPKVYPHFLLCSPKGVIKFLPDHMHEGQCYVPTCMDGALFYDGAEHPEYPSSHTVKPEIIAMAQVPEPHVTLKDADTCFPVTKVSSFSLIGVYDGHQGNVGRVVVDSTFHHFVNMNLRGFEDSKDYQSKDKGKQAYEYIKRYFQNIGVWLAPKEKQSQFRNISIWNAQWKYPLAEEILSISDKLDLEKIDSRYTIFIGAMTRSVLDKLASPCLALRWALDLMSGLVEEGVDIPFADPWRPEIAADSSPATWPDTEIIADAVLGGVMLVVANGVRVQRLNLAESAQDLLSDATQTGSLIGIQAFSQYLKISRTKMKAIGKALNKAFNLQA